MATKKEINELFTRIIKNNYCNKPLWNKEDTKAIIDVLKTSPTYQKAASIEGVQLIPKIVSVGSRGVKMLCLVNPGFSIPISKTKLLKSLPNNRKPNKTDPLKDYCNKVRIAFRRAIDDQIKERRGKLKFPCQCHLTGATVYHHKEIDIDHTPSFVLLVERWLELNNLYYDEIEIKGSPTKKEFKDPEQLKSWQEYHRHNATLTPVKSGVNRSKGANDFTTTNRLTRNATYLDSNQLLID